MGPRVLTMIDIHIQCRDGFAGDGEECEQDLDLDAIPVKGLSCTLPNCRKVSSNANHFILMLSCRAYSSTITYQL